VRRLARADLACFYVAVHPDLELARHTALLMEAIERAQEGIAGAVRCLLHRSDRLLISEPPRRGETLLLELLCSWYLGRHSERSVILATYSGRQRQACAQLLSDSLFGAIFPACRLSADSSLQRRFDNTAGGSFYAVGCGGPVTGHGCSLLVCDDLLKGRRRSAQRDDPQGLCTAGSPALALRG